MNDLDELESRLRRTYQAVADRTMVPSELRPPPAAPATLVEGLAPAAPPADLQPGWELIGREVTTERTFSERPARSPAVRWVAAAVVLGGIAAAVGLGVAGRTDDRPPVATGAGLGSWQVLAEPPNGHVGQGLVWTGAEFLRFGGYGQARSTEAAAYDPATDTWRTLADMPDELAGAGMGVWTGSELLVLPSEEGGVAATYEPATDTWELLSDPAIPFVRTESYAFWTGDRVLVAGLPSSGGEPSDVGNDLGARAVLYDPATGEWEDLPDAPVPLAANSAGVWTGREAVFVSQEPVRVGPDAPAPGVTTLALDPTAGTWRELPAPPLSTREVPLLAWTGTEVVMAGGVAVPDTADPDGSALADAAALDPATGVWRPYPAPPVAVFGDDVAAQPSVATARGQVVALQTTDARRRPLILTPGTETWQLGAAPPAGDAAQPGWSAASTGTEVVAVGEGRALSFTPPDGP